MRIRRAVCQSRVREPAGECPSRVLPVHESDSELVHRHCRPYSENDAMLPSRVSSVRAVAAAVKHRSGSAPPRQQNPRLVETAIANGVTAL